jgi:hypothetical protein
MNSSSWKLADATTWARDLYDKHVDRKDAAGFAAAFTEDGTVRFGNNDTLHGRQAIEQAIAGFFTAMKALKHETKKVTVHDNMMFLEAFVTYDRHDGKKVTVPAMTVYEMADTPTGKKAKECRIYVDLAPLFAP